MQQQHASKSKKYKCNLCDDLFQNKSNFLTHTFRRHKGIDATEFFSIVWIENTKVGTIMTSCNSLLGIVQIDRSINIIFSFI